MKDKQQEIESFFKAFGKSLTNKEKEYYTQNLNETLHELTKSFHDQPNKTPEHFYYSVVHHLERFQKGFIKTTISESRELTWLYLNQSFVKNNFQTLIRQKEGMVCCADKSRYIIESLALFFKDGTKMMQEPPKDEEYFRTRVIFNTHDWVIDFFNALFALHNGGYERYCTELKRTLDLSNELIKQEIENGK